MAWDVEGTQRRLRQAALVEFAEHGPDAATMTRIASRAGINKERLYAYFGDKRSLFDLVLADALAELSAAVCPNGTEFEEVDELAGRAFDYYSSHPELVRLLQWEGLRRGPAADAAGRAAHYRERIEAARDAQADGFIDADIDPAFAIFTLVALTASWCALPQLASIITEGDAEAASEHARRRAFVVEAFRRIMAAPAGPEELRRGRRDGEAVSVASRNGKLLPAAAFGRVPSATPG